MSLKIVGVSLPKGEWFVGVLPAGRHDHQVRTVLEGFQRRDDELLGIMVVNGPLGLDVGDEDLLIVERDELGAFQRGALGEQRRDVLAVHLAGALEGEVRNVEAGWLNVRRDVNPLIAHWGTVHHVQTHTGFRGRGIGAALMHRLGDVAREEMDLEQLHLAARGGMGLEDFYGRLGWKEIGRWPGALRFAPGDDLDEILMMLTL